MELEGNLSSFSFPEVLQFLGQQKMTGVLTVVRGDTEVRLEIREGKIVNSSTIDRPLKVGEMLVHRGLIPRSNLDEALASQRDENQGRLLGEVLIERGFVTQDQLRSAVKLQMEEEIWDIFGWKDGSFNFEHVEASQQRPGQVEIDIEPLLLDGSRRMDEWEHISKNIPGDASIYSVGPIPREFDGDLKLQEREWQVLSMLNGFYNVESLVTRTGFGTFETYRILNTLLMTGIVHLREGSGGAKSVTRPIEPSTRTNAFADAGSAAPVSESSMNLKRIGGMFSRIGKSAAPVAEEPATIAAPDGPAVIFVTPVGLMAHCIGRLWEQLSAHEDFALGKRDSEWLAHTWREIVNICPKADLLTVRGRRIEAGDFEAFAMRVGPDSISIQGCYEDGLAAMSRLLKRIFESAAQQLGDKTARKIFNGVAGSVESRSRLENYNEFGLKRFIEDAIH